MSKKTKNALLISAGVIALFAVCAVCIYFYAQYTINKPKFEVPEEAPLVSATEMPETELQMINYIAAAFDKAFTSETNVTKSVNVYADESKVRTALSESDKTVALLSLTHGIDALKGDYETYEKLNSDELPTVPSFALDKEEIKESSFTEGFTNDIGEIENTEYYYFDLTVSPKRNEATFDTDLDKEPLAKLKESFGDSIIINEDSKEVFIKSCRVEGRADRACDELDYIVLTHTYTVSVEVEFTGEYASMKKVYFIFDYVVETRYDFVWYGARFTKDAVYMNPGDSQALPASVVVADDASKDDFKLTFTSSDEKVLTVDEDGIIDAKQASDEPVTVTVTLKYRGFTYTDTISVTVTDLEVE